MTFEVWSGSRTEFYPILGAEISLFLIGVFRCRVFAAYRLRGPQGYLIILLIISYVGYNQGQNVQQETYWYFANESKIYKELNGFSVNKNSVQQFVYQWMPNAHWHGEQYFEQFLYQLIFTSCSWFCLNKVVFIWIVIIMYLKRLTGLYLFYCEVM